MAPVGDDTSRRSHGRYVLGDLLGRGGMAEVFAGFVMGSHGFQKPVAIKRLLPSLANDHVFVERLISEAKLLVGMQHGNVVSVLDLARDGEDVFLVMEFVDGPSLRGLVKARAARGVSQGIAAYIVQSAAAGLQFAHARPGGAVIHADISPSNLLLTTSGEVRVADFGIARREGIGEGIVEGKWAYMAPEQVRGDALTPAADVFALGIVMYELICGRHPLGRRVTGGERESQPLRVVPPRIVDSAITPGMEAICLRALAHDPADRFATMQELMDALSDERFANGWREGAADLAAAIREVDLGGAAPLPTQVMEQQQQHTLVTRSLLANGTQPGTAPGTQPAPVPLPMPMPTPVAAIVVPPPRAWWKLGVLGGATLVGVIAAVVMATPGDIAPVSTQQPTPQLQVTATPIAVAVPVPVAVLEPAPPPAVAVAASAPAIPAPALPVAVAPVPQSQSQPQPHKPAAPVAVKKGVLNVTSVPWAYVTVDDTLKDETPVARFTLPVGHHTVRLKNNESGATVTRQITVTATEPALVRVRAEDWQ